MIVARGAEVYCIPKEHDVRVTVGRVFGEGTLISRGVPPA